MLGPESLISHFLLSPLPIVLPKNHPSSSFLQHDDDTPESLRQCRDPGAPRPLCLGA